MEQVDRTTIDRLCEPFSSRINMETLWPRLVANKVFNADDVNVPSWQGKLTRQDTIREILQTIKTRGPRAFENLAVSLRQTGQHLLADILQGHEIPPLDYNISNDNNTSANDENVNNASMSDDYHENIYYTTEPLQIKVKKAEEFCDGPEYTNVRKYRMRSRPRGYVLIITNISYIKKKKRKAAEHDEANLKKLFEAMGFEVTSKMDLTGATMKQVIRDFSQRDFRLIDSCFVIISAHGSVTVKNGYSDTEIEGIDYEMPNAEKLLCTEIVDFFNAENCKTLIRKPKIFIFQACRGERKQYAARVVTDGIDNKVLTIPSYSRNYSDILVAHSTIPGHVAYRDKVKGSWYIEILCDVFMNYACTTHVQDLFNMVDSRLMNLRSDSESQTSTVKSLGFNKHCYLNPGLFEDS